MEREGRHLDIWMPGTVAILPLHLTCYIRIADWTNVQVFELIVNSDLFKYEAYEKYSLDAPAGHLWQMMCFTGERFTPEQLDSSDFADEYLTIFVRLSLPLRVLFSPTPRFFSLLIASSPPR